MFKKIRYHKKEDMTTIQFYYGDNMPNQYSNPPMEEIYGKNGTRSSVYFKKNNTCFIRKTITCKTNDKSMIQPVQILLFGSTAELWLKKFKNYAEHDNITNALVKMSMYASDTSFIIYCLNDHIVYAGCGKLQVRPLFVFEWIKQRKREYAILLDKRIVNTYSEQLFEIEPDSWIKINCNDVDNYKFTYEQAELKDVKIKTFAKKVRLMREDDQLDDLMNSVRFNKVDTVCTLLSGGSNSTKVLKYLSDKRSNRIHTFTIGFHDSNRLFHACREISKKFNTHHHEVIIEAKDVANATCDLTKVLNIYEPSIIKRVTPLFILIRYIETNFQDNDIDIKTIFTGEKNKNNRLYLSRCSKTTNIVALPEFISDINLPADVETIDEGITRWDKIYKNLFCQRISDDEFGMRHLQYPVDTPRTKEEFFCRKIHDYFYPRK